ncbi:MAG TPA: insulinase family protein, partial [Planctomycetota bacterium]|nr:insulinase family protein [Planctomycetota bacterium]
MKLLSIPIGVVAIFAAHGFAQDPGPERGLAPGRGDLHSKGWEAAMAVRGEPLPPRFPELGRDARRVELENGLVLFLRADRRLPLVQLEALVRVGERFEQPNEHGVAGFLATLLRSGGTASWKPQELDDRLAFLAANLGVSIGEDSGTVSLDLLSKDAEEGLAIFTEVLRAPAFDEGRL